MWLLAYQWGKDGNDVSTPLSPVFAVPNTGYWCLTSLNIAEMISEFQIQVIIFSVVGLGQFNVIRLSLVERSHVTTPAER